MGKQTWGCLINLVGQFCVAGPAAIVMAFVLDLGLPGLLAGLMLGVIVQAAIYMFILLRGVNWPALAAKVAAEHAAEAQRGVLSVQKPPDAV